MKFHIFTGPPTTDIPENDPYYSETLQAADHKSAAEAAEGPTMLGAVVHLWVLADGDFTWGAEHFAVCLVTSAHAPTQPAHFGPLKQLMKTFRLFYEQPTFDPDKGEAPWEDAAYIGNVEAENARAAVYKQDPPEEFDREDAIWVLRDGDYPKDAEKWGIIQYAPRVEVRRLD